MTYRYRQLVAIIGLLFIQWNIFGQNSNGVNTTIKVMSFNILHGATTKGNFDLDAIAKVIIDENPDFVTLQEVDFKTKRAKGYDLATELGWRTKMASVFGKAMEYSGGEYGEAVLSKYSFLNTRNVPLPFSPSNEPRAALEVTVVLMNKDTVSIIGTHLDHLEDETDRLKQVKEINKVFSNNRYPSLLIGDLNGTPDSKPIQILEDIWTSSHFKKNPLMTFPSDGPIKTIDYVMYLPKHRWQVINQKTVCDQIASDHCAYVVELELLD